MVGRRGREVQWWVGGGGVKFNGGWVGRGGGINGK